MEFNIARTVLSSILGDPEKLCVIDDENSLTRRDLFLHVINRINELQSKNVNAGDFVIVLCDKGLSFWIDLLALWSMGARPVCLESTPEESHAENVLKLSGAKFVSPGDLVIPAAFQALISIEPVNFSLETSGSAPLSLANIPFSQDTADVEMAGLIFTSGTTGLPKGVPLTHKSLVQNALGTATRIGLRPSDTLMIATPFRFISSISHFVVTLISGAIFFGTERKLMAGDLIETLKQNDITSFGGSPFHARMISYSNSETLPKLRWLMSSGDHLPVEVIDALKISFPDIFINTVYGMAELGGRFCCLPNEYLDQNKGSVGYPISGLELVLLNDDGKECEYGEIGFLYARGSISFPGYYKNSAANDKVISDIGFKTGDVGYFSESGFLYLSGRSDSVFKRSGLKVSSQVVTDAILALKIFDDVFVMGKEDPIEGHVPVAYVTTNSDPITKGALLKLLRPVLANNHLPKECIYLPHIPRTGSGKVQRKKLLELAQNTSS